MFRRCAVILLVLCTSPLALGQQELPPLLREVDFSLWADRWETELDVLSVLPAAERQRQFIDNMRQWREEFMGIAFAFRGLSRPQARELRRRMREQFVAQVGQERLTELTDRFRGEMGFQRDAFLALDDAERQALIRRFWSPAGEEEASLRARLELSGEEWDVVAELIARIRRLQRELAAKEATHRQAFRKLVDDASTTPEAYHEELKALRQTRTHYQAELGKLREQLRELVTVKQEGHLVVEGILD